MFSLRFTCVLFLIKLCKARICLLFAFIILKRERDRQFVFFITFSVACKFFLKSQDSKFPRNSNCTKIEYKSYKKDTKKPAKKVVKKNAAAKPAAKKTTTKKAAPFARLILVIFLCCSFSTSLKVHLLSKEDKFVLYLSLVRI